MTELSRGYILILVLLSTLSLTAVSAQGASGPSKVESLGAMVQLQVTEIKEFERNGLLSIQVEILNKSRHNQRLFYRCKWMDLSGIIVWEEEPWKPIVVYGKEKHLISIVAPTNQAKDYRIQLQSPENVTSPR